MMGTVALAGKLVGLVPDALALEKTPARQPSESGGESHQDARTSQSDAAGFSASVWVSASGAPVLVAMVDTTCGVDGLAIQGENEWSDTVHKFRLLKTILVRIALPHTRRTNQNRTIYRGDSSWDKGFWRGQRDLDEARIVVASSGRQIARTIRHVPPSHAQMPLC